MSKDQHKEHIINQIELGNAPISGTELEVAKDIFRRQQLGIKKYGTTVKDNPLTLTQWLQHAYEETLDAAVYLKRAIAELEGEQGHE